MLKVIYSENGEVRSEWFLLYILDEERLTFLSQMESPAKLSIKMSEACAHTPSEYRMKYEQRQHSWRRN
jgi:hypothetical protein